MQSELPQPKEKIDDDDLDEVTFVEYMAILSSLDKSIFEALKPFNGLQYLSPTEFKAIVAKSVEVFKLKDEDSSGGLNMVYTLTKYTELSRSLKFKHNVLQEEYLKEEDNSDNKKRKILDKEQKEAIFKVIDRNGDGEISFSEFQAMIPQGPNNMDKNLDALFKEADKDSDGFWSKVTILNLYFKLFLMKHINSKF